MREQEHWLDHAAFIDRLIEDRFVLLGGPVADATLATDDRVSLTAPVGEDRPYRATLVVEAPDSAEVGRRLDEDPWILHGLLTRTAIDRWEVLAGDPAATDRVRS